MCKLLVLSKLTKIPGPNPPRLDDSVWIVLGEYDSLRFDLREQIPEPADDRRPKDNSYQRVASLLELVEPPDFHSLKKHLDSGDPPLLVHSSFKINTNLLVAGPLSILDSVLGVVRDVVADGPVARDNAFLFRSTDTADFSLIVFPERLSEAADLVMKLRRLKLRDFLGMCEQRQFLQADLIERIRTTEKPRLPAAHVFSNSYSIPAVFFANLAPPALGEDRRTQCHALLRFFPGHESELPRLLALEDPTDQFSQRRPSPLFLLGPNDVLLSPLDIQTALELVRRKLIAERDWLGAVPPQQYSILSSRTETSFDVIPEPDPDLAGALPLQRRPKAFESIRGYEDVLQKCFEAELLTQDLLRALQNVFRACCEVAMEVNLWYCLIDVADFVSEFLAELQNIIEEIAGLPPNERGQYRTRYTPQIQRACGDLAYALSSRTYGEFFANSRYLPFEQEASHHKQIVALAAIGDEALRSVCVQTDFSSPLLITVGTKQDIQVEFHLQKLTVVNIGANDLSSPIESGIRLIHDVSHNSNYFLDRPEFRTTLVDILQYAFSHDLVSRLAEVARLTSTAENNEPVPGSAILQVVYSGGVEDELETLARFVGCYVIDRLVWTAPALRIAETYGDFVPYLLAALDEVDPLVDGDFWQNPAVAVLPRALLEDGGLTRCGIARSLQRCIWVLEDLLADFQAACIVGRDNYLAFAVREVRHRVYPDVHGSRLAFMVSSFFEDRYEGTAVGLCGGYDLEILRFLLHSFHPFRVWLRSALREGRVDVLRSNWLCELYATYYAGIDVASLIQAGATPTEDHMQDLERRQMPEREMHCLWEAWSRFFSEIELV